MDVYAHGNEEDSDDQRKALQVRRILRRVEWA
jgi:hypothetical protein